MALKITTIADSIAGLSVSGVTLYDIDEIPTAIISRDVPAIIPRPDDYITDFEPEVNSLGTGSTAKMTVRYTLNYRLYHSKLGTGRRSLFDTYSGMVTKIGLFLDALIAADAVSGSLDSRPISISNVGAVPSPAEEGVAFHGCDIGVRITEFVN